MFAFEVFVLAIVIAGLSALTIAARLQQRRHLEDRVMNAMRAPVEKSRNI